ncbi:MAG: helix-turn-helix domain-containing protein [Bacteroidales bacterium]|nr:helix-turn-helix domain-containing protein [Bacteroidales bacterium]
MDTNKFVGEKIKFFREEQDLSIVDLAEKTGLAIEQIERIENNTDIPSLAPLIKIAKALGTRIGTFLDDQTENGPVICRKEEAKETISFSNNSVNSRRHMHYQSLSRSKANRHMEPFIIEIEPNNGNNDVDFILSSHEGEEFIIVMEGIIEISYGKQAFILEEGDSIYYDSIVPHHVHSYEGKPAKILAVVYTPL